MSKDEGLFQVKIKASFLQNHHSLSLPLHFSD